MIPAMLKVLDPRSVVYSRWLLLIALTLVFARPPLADNVCNVCQANLALGQTGSCDESLPSSVKNLGQLCHLCYPGVPTSQPDREIVISAEQFQGYELFKFDSVNSSENQLLFANERHQFRIDVKDLQGEWETMGLPERSSIIRMWSNSEISTTLNIPPGFYQMKVYGEHDRPGPGLLHVSLKQEPVGTLEFSHDDDTWDSKCLWLHPIHWSSSKVKKDLSLNIRFLNDGGEQGSQDAGIAWVKIVPYTDQ
jgi:hypothetical protein